MTTNPIEDLALGDDVQIIREILFGQQAKQMQERIKKLEEAVTTLQGENAQLNDELRKERQQREDEQHELSQQLNQSIATETQDRVKAINGLDQNLTSLLEKTRDQILAQQQNQAADQTGLLDELLASLATYQKKLNAK
jgi:hypothetical protein